MKFIIIGDDKMKNTDSPKFKFSLGGSEITVSFKEKSSTNANTVLFNIISGIYKERIKSDTEKEKHLTET